MIDRQISDNDDIDRLYHDLKQAIIETSDICIPKSTFCSHLKPYWTKELKQLHNIQKDLRIIWIQQGKPRGNEHISYREYKHAKYTFAKALKKSASTYEQTKYDDISRYHEMDMSAFWKYVRKRKDMDDNSVVMRDDRLSYDTPESQLHMRKDHYEHLLNEQTDDTGFDNDFKDIIDAEIHSLCQSMEPSRDSPGVDLTTPFTVDEIRQVCSTLPNGKAPGYDLIQYEHLKFAGVNFHVVLCKLFNWITQNLHMYTKDIQDWVID